jgi:deazaflavin-dependent oxidoreductase (nitroreductase family)
VNPSWYFNVRANRAAVVEVGDKCFSITARIAEGPERERLFRIAADSISEYDDCQARTERRLPVIVLENTQTTDFRTRSRWRGAPSSTFESFGTVG